jgi:ribosomal protein L37AE/L43A
MQDPVWMPRYDERRERRHCYSCHMYTWHERGLLGIPRCEQCNNSDLDAPVQPSLSESLKRNHG